MIGYTESATILNGLRMRFASSQSRPFINAETHHTSRSLKLQPDEIP
jgi:hypothetical protein